MIIQFHIHSSHNPFQTSGHEKRGVPAMDVDPSGLCRRATLHFHAAPVATTNGTGWIVRRHIVLDAPHEPRHYYERHRAHPASVCSRCAARAALAAATRPHAGSAVEPCHSLAHHCAQLNNYVLPAARLDEPRPIRSPETTQERTDT